MSLFQSKWFWVCAVVCIGVTGFFGVQTYKQESYNTTQQNKPQARTGETSTPVDHSHVHGHGSASHSHEIDEIPSTDTYDWRDRSSFESVQRLLKIDPEAARTELQKVSKTFFSGHILVEEWVPLYCRISQDGFRYISDVIRLHELEIRMLSAINGDKYQKLIQQHQEAIEYYTEFSRESPNFTNGVGKETYTIEKIRPDEQESTPELSREIPDAVQHFEKFFQLIDTNPEAARIELDLYTTILFQNHPSSEEWKELFFRIARDKGALVPEIIRFIELKNQMLTNNNPDASIWITQMEVDLLKNLKSISETYESEGKLETEKFPFVMKYGK